MKLVVEFDIYADLLEVPASVVEQRNKLRNQFLDWLYNPKSRHNHYKYMVDAAGRRTKCMVYGTKEFVEWLNRKALRSSEEKATIAASDIDTDQYKDVPSIFF